MSDYTPKIFAVCAAVGLGAALGYWFWNRAKTPAPTDSFFVSEAKSHHYDMNFVQRARTEFLNLENKSHLVSKETFLAWMKKVLHVGPHASPTVTSTAAFYAAKERPIEQDLTLSIIFDAYDKDANGEIDCREFLNGLALLSSSSIEEKAKFIFEAWDENGDGYLSVPELEHAYRRALRSAATLTENQARMSLGIVWGLPKTVIKTSTALFDGITKEKEDAIIYEHVQNLLRLADDNKDGKISKDEWIKHARDIPLLQQLDFSHSKKPEFQVTVVTDKYRCILGEGPHWDHKAKLLYFIDILGKKLLSVDPVTEDLETYPVGDLIGCAAPCKNRDKTFIIGTQEGVQFFHLPTKKKTMLIRRDDMEKGKPENRFNDGKVDAQGRLWIGTMSTNEDLLQQGSFFRVDTDGKFELQFDQVSISNGLAWSLDQTKLYYIDSLAHCVAQFKYDAQTGKLSDRKVIIKIPRELGIPDGMTIDSDGCLWVAMYAGYKVIRWDPTTGSLLRIIPIPCPYVTSVCFGGPNLDILYVTTASRNNDDTKYPLAGYVFAVTGLGVKGLPMNEYAG